MRLRRLALPALLIFLTPPLAWAAPQGKVIVAQGVDPSTLDPMNHQETPVSNVAVNIFDTLLERDQELNIVGRGRRRDATLPAARPLRGHQADGVEGARRRAVEGLRHGPQVG